MNNNVRAESFPGLKGELSSLSNPSMGTGLG